MRLRLAACAALLLVPGCGEESPPVARGGQSVAQLTVSVMASPDARARTAKLTCGSDNSGTGWLAGAADAACRNVLAQRSLLTKGPPERRVCTQVYGGPQQASIGGSIKGREVDLHVTRSDGCGIAEWNALEDLLGPPPGTAEAY